MIVDVTDTEQSGSFELPGGGTLELRLLSVADLKQLRDTCVKITPEYPKLDDGQYHRFEGLQWDKDLWDALAWDLTIKSWSKLFDRDGNEIPVTRDNKVLLMTRSAQFRQAYDDGMKALKEAEKEALKEQEKNS